MPEESKLKDSCIARHHIYKGTLNLYTYVFPLCSPLSKSKLRLVHNLCSALASTCRHDPTELPKRFVKTSGKSECKMMSIEKPRFAERKNALRRELAEENENSIVSNQGGLLEVS